MSSIQKRRNDLEAWLEFLNEMHEKNVKFIQDQLEQLRRECTHPQTQVLNVQYETIVWCIDCGKEM